MSVRVRLTRVGSKKNPIWRVVVADQRSPRDGRSIETLGHYNPQTDPSTIVIDRERLDHWIEQGAKPTDSVLKLMRAPNTEAPQAERLSPEELVAQGASTPPEPEAEAEEAAAEEPASEGAGDAEQEPEEGNADSQPEPVASAEAEGDATPAADDAGDDSSS